MNSWVYYHRGDLNASGLWFNAHAVLCRTSFISAVRYRSLLILLLPYRSTYLPFPLLTRSLDMRGPVLYSAVYSLDWPGVCIKHLSYQGILVQTGRQRLHSFVIFRSFTVHRDPPCFAFYRQSLVSTFLSIQTSALPPCPPPLLISYATVSGEFRFPSFRDTRPGA